MEPIQTTLVKFHQLVQEEWEATMRFEPLNATIYYGDYRFNDRLSPASEEDYIARLDSKLSFQNRLSEIDRSALPSDEQLNYDIFNRYLASEIDELRFRPDRMPISKTGGFHADFPELPRFIPLANYNDYTNYVARLRAFHVFVDQNIERMRVGLDSGQLPARVTLEGVSDSIRPHIVADPDESLLYAPFKDFPAAISQTLYTELREAARASIRNSIVPGYVKLLDFIENEYIPAASEAIGASNLPDGAAYYRHRIRYYTSLDLTAEEIHQTGLEEVHRIREEMDASIKNSGFSGDFHAFIEFLRKDPRFYVSTPDELLKEVAYVLKKIDGELPRLFGKLPRLPYGIRPVPDYLAPHTTTAYYMPSAGDNTRAGVYYVNTSELSSRPLYEIEALSLHEAVPGHHLQIALQQELTELPGFRRYAGYTGFSTAYIEGWALYAERLGLEIGFYRDAYSDFGRLSYEMWRACRLVVDTGMHTLGWSRQRAIDFMMEHTSSTLLNVTNEIDRYIAWPGQALAYKIGELKIRQLRTIAEDELASKFDLRRFHDLLLSSGPLPLDLLEAGVKDWIAGQS